MSYKRLAQFKTVIENDKCRFWNTAENEKELTSTFLQPVDINYQIPSTCKLLCPDYVGYTALHFALAKEKLDFFRGAIAAGINFTLKNDKGETIVHEALKKNCIGKLVWKFKDIWENPFINAILSAHVTFSNTDNPSDKYGITHFHVAVMTNHVQAVEFFLKNNVLINEVIGTDSKELQGFTPLHLAARYCNLETAALLVKYGADVNLRNGKNMTPVHLLIEQNMSIMDWIKMGKQSNYSELKKEMRKNEEIINVLLENYANPDDNGLTHFQIACTMQDFKMVECLLEHNVNLNDQINCNSCIWPGYSPLHFAAHFNFDVVKLLLRQGANILTRDAEGVTPFDLCLQWYEAEDLSYLIANEPTWSNIKLSDNKTLLLDIIIAMKSKNTFEAFIKESGTDINLCIPMNAPLWAGYTILHLAIALFPKKKQDDDLYFGTDYQVISSLHYNWIEDEEGFYLERIKICLDYGADVCIQNARGYTPLHLAVKLQREKIVYLLLQFHGKIVNVVDEDGVSHLHIAVATGNENVMSTLLDSGADVNAPTKCEIVFTKISCIEGDDIHQTYLINKGSTPLHIAFLFCSAASILEKLLERGADLYARDANDLTPIHRIFTINATSSYYGAGPFEQGDMFPLLASSRLEPPTLSYIIISLSDYMRNVCKLLDNLKDYSSEAGLSHLHIACLANSIEFVKKLLDKGADVNAPISYKKPSNNNDYSKSSGSVDPYNDSSLEPLFFLSELLGSRPLHLAVMNEDCQAMVMILLDRGADIFADNGKGSVPLYSILNNNIYDLRDLFMIVLKIKNDLQERLEKETGFTMLHLACLSLDSSSIKDLLNGGADVNGKIYEQSPVMPGCTPLHVALNADWWGDQFDELSEILLILVESGADVTLFNANQLTPVCMAQEKCLPEELTRYLLESQKNFKINPVNTRGITHFHLACLTNDETAIKKFLENGVDVNYPIDYFNGSDNNGGQSPLHLLVAKSSLEMINLLLKYNVNVQADDCLGNTPLHIAAMHRPALNKSVFESLISHGADVNAENSFKETPFELLLKNYDTQTVDTIKLFLKNDCHINQFNRLSEEGFLLNAIYIGDGMGKEEQEFYLTMIVNDPSIKEIDDLGCNAIHNVVSCYRNWNTPKYFVNVIKRFHDLGCKIDLQDLQGRTPLHLATKYNNILAVKILLDCGADINIINSNGQTALTDNLYGFNDFLLDKNLSMCVKLMQIAGLYVNKLNTEATAEFFVDNLELWNSNATFEELNQKTIASSPFRLGDLLSETGIVANYPHMLPEERQIIDEFFLTNRGKLRKEFGLWAGILKLQYRKARARDELIRDAKASFNVLTNFLIPDLCCIIIFRFLSNHELKNLIATTNID